MKRILFLLLVLPGLCLAGVEVHPLDFDLPSVVPRNAVRLPMYKFEVKAVDEDMQVSEVMFRHGGLSYTRDFGRLWLESNRYERSLRSSIDTDGVLRVKFWRPLIIDEGEGRMFTLYGNLNMQNGQGRSFSFGLVELAADPSLGTQTVVPRYGAYRRVLRRVSRVSR